ncbi:AAA family ATPase [Desulfovibrio sp. OttesenSCG-928-A18]|nr:AAA family ATPase [Desulfovibrio sp. OttesenSCG-928-A18]
MKDYRPLPADKLRACLPPERIPHADSRAIPRNGKRHSPQQRALEALELGLSISASGFNIYVAGEADLGRSFLLRDFLGPRAKKGLTPPDLVYVYNFSDPDSPCLVTLPAGYGRRLKKQLTKAFAAIQKEVAQRLESNAYLRRHSSMLLSFQTRRENMLQRMNRLASAQGFNLGLDEAGSMTLYPLVEGKRLNEQEYDSLESGLRAQLKSRGDSLMQPISEYLRKLAKMEQSFHEQERRLERELVDSVLAGILDPLAEKILQSCDNDGLRRFFENLRSDTLEHLDVLLPPDMQGAPPNSRQNSPLFPHEGPAPEDLGGRYDVNVFVDNAKTVGAPLIFDDHPTLSNLMGCIEREAEMGALVTDFSLIKAGSIHKANGGYLVLHLEDILQHPTAWEALIRAMRSGISRVEDSGEEDSSKAKGLHPEAVPLSLKLILIGKEELYEMMLAADDRFSKLFKIKAHLTEHMQRNSAGIRIYLSHIRRIIDDDALLHFDRAALAGLVDFGSRIIEDQQKLSLKYPLLRELMVEASTYAALEKNELVTGKILNKALRARYFRSSLVEESFMEEYDRGIIKVATSGEAVGMANGLAVSMFGDFEFGLPHQISCTVGVGSGGIIDLERDAKLSGPIHTKAMMILKSYLVGAFAHNKPIVLTGSLGFEQNYAGIEGDSASGAELATLLSALADVPIRLSLAFTGAVAQSGHIMAVGSVTRKIEGFFEVCKRHGLSGKQGVIMPRDNISHTLLRDEVIDAVRAGKFHIYPVTHITEAMEILTGIPSGRLRKNGTYSENSLYSMVDKRLRVLAQISARQLSAKGR